MNDLQRAKTGIDRAHPSEHKKHVRSQALCGPAPFYGVRVSGLLGSYIDQLRRFGLREGEIAHHLAAEERKYLDAQARKR